MNGRHRNGSPLFTAVRVGVAGLVVALVLGGSWYGYHRLSSPGCSKHTSLSVSAAPEIVPALSNAAKQWQKTREAGCVRVVVTAAEPAEVAAAIAGRRGAVLTGVGRPSGNTTVPDVWVPDSSLWLQRLRTAGPGFVPAEALPIASSAVVLGVPEPVATALGWTSAKLTWNDLLAKASSDATLRLGVVEPSRDSAGLGALLTLAAVAGGETNPQPAMVAAMRALAAGRSQVRDDLLRRFPRASDAVTLSSSLTLAPLSEQAILTFNAAKPPVKLLPISVRPAPKALDFPYVVLPETSGVKATAAANLRGAMVGQAFTDQLSKAGLRSSDGTMGALFPTGTPIVVEADAATAAVADGASIEKLLQTWATLTMPARVLAVIDVSGSMLEPVPTVGGASRIAVTLEAARRGLALFDDSWAVGLWTFSTQLVGNQDWQEMAPIGPLATQRDRMLAAINQIKPKPTGDTGLYDTVLAAYKAVQDGWDPGKINSVVLLTDGQNDDANGISLDQLIAQLKTVIDPKKPIQVILIGIGEAINEAAMKRITDVTTGGVFTVPDPAKIGEVFLKAISMRPDSMPK